MARPHPGLGRRRRMDGQTDKREELPLWAKVRNRTVGFRSESPSHRHPVSIEPAKQVLVNSIRASKHEWDV
ncbi:BZ3500_MvSof-1268-A1-R1_Chr9g10849 [Microbotryum saponariae]|uniref:BZ3500_MvSof-1268-A1-R1_Chr9g10849 protein n=1 Tax=Microbotryum saponariae TaxID=289078 RepID=A0A2X0LNU3_9BASI|nr:BZ3501_MvSof-1269-A2-R1_Chr9g10597 [Microbotryum saponariae]SDA00803.1 BZ3500_MvSof-1268-A1-R1_Chr9g10849 [Microbotryum saponariae]